MRVGDIAMTLRGCVDKTDDQLSPTVNTILNLNSDFSRQTLTFKHVGKLTFDISSAKCIRPNSGWKINGLNVLNTPTLNPVPIWLPNPCQHGHLHSEDPWPLACGSHPKSDRTRIQSLAPVP